MMLRRPPTTLQLTQEDITAYEHSRAQRAAQRAQRAQQQRTRHKTQNLQQYPQQKQASKPIFSPPPPPPAPPSEQQHMEEGDTEPEESDEDTGVAEEVEDEEDEEDEELDNSHLAARQRQRPPQPGDDPGAPQRHRAPQRQRAQQTQGHPQQRFMERAPPPPFLRPPSGVPNGGVSLERTTAEVEHSDEDEEMRDLDTPTGGAAVTAAAAAARRERRKGIPPRGEGMLDGAGDVGSSRGHVAVHGRRHGSVDAGTNAVSREEQRGGPEQQREGREQQGREARDRQARERVMGVGSGGAASSSRHGPGVGMGGARVTAASAMYGARDRGVDGR